MSTVRALALTEEERERASWIREIAAKGTSALDDLIAQLDDPSWAVRRAVTAALAAMGEPAIGPLTQVLATRRDNEARLAAAVDALVASSGDADRAALHLAESSSPPVVCDAAQILGRRRSAAALAKLASLAQDPNDNVALAAIEALGRIGIDAAITPLIAALESRNFFRAFPAIDVLGRSGNPRAVRPLIAAMAEPHYTIEAARALGRLGDPAAVPSLVALLAKPIDAVVRAAAVALVEIYDRQIERFGASADPLRGVDLHFATARINPCLDHCDATEQTALVRLLGWIGDATAVAALVDLLACDAAIAQAAAGALLRLGDVAQPQLVDALRAGGSERRLVILPLLRHKSAVAEPVADCLTDSSPMVRALACDALARIGEATIVPRLFALLADTDARVGQSALAAIQSLGSNETEHLALSAATSADWRVRRAGLRIIAYFGYPSGTDALLEGMNEADERIRDAAIAGLPYLDDPRAIDALVRAAAHPSARTRAGAIRAIGQTAKQERTLLVLRTALSDADPWVRYFACQALSRLKDERSADLVSGLLSDPAGHVRVAAIEALAQLRGVRALAALQTAAAGDDADVRRAALLGLGQVKDATSLPVLRAALRADDAATRLVALSAIAEYDLREVAPAFSDALADPEESVRHAAIALLASRNEPIATRILIANLTNNVLRTRIVAALAQSAPGRVEMLAESLTTAGDVAPDLVAALVRSGRSEAVSALERAFASADVAVRRAVAPALGRLGSNAARALLAKAAVEDVDETVRLLSADALER